MFFMGCPLRCDWCHNPESQNYGTSYLCDRERCRGCLSCRGRREYDCLFDARKTVGYDISPAELIDGLEKDRLFFEESGGGITVSGGEPLAQPEALLALLQLCREHDIPVCLDTSGSFRRDNPPGAEMLLKIAGLCQRILFDIKILDPELFKRHTGGDLPQILSTLEIFLTSETAVELRIPLIPGINDDSASAFRRNRYFQTLKDNHPGKPEMITYLEYHETGRHKYEQLGRVYPMDSLK